MKEESNIYISEDAIIEEGVTIYPNVSIRGKSIIKKGTVIDSNTIITDSVVGEDNHIINSVIESGNTIGNHNKIGPFTHLRENNKIGDYNQIGSYVEVKESLIDSHNQIKHMAYIGNAHLGSNINVGAGVIFANYHSKKDKKEEIYLEDGVSIGSNTTLIAPLKISKNTLIGANSTVEKDIEKDSLYINRTGEVYKKNYYGEKVI